MEGDEIGIVLSRASELRSKITNCVEKATRRARDDEGGEEEEEEEEEKGEGEGERDTRSRSRSVESVGETDKDSESLLNIIDALESLEEQLSSLQVLQQQQRYEREATLAEIDHSRKILLEKLSEYKGEDLEVIHEASAFASETVDHNDDLLLPPYPSRIPRPLILGNGYPSTRKYTENGVIGLGRIQEAKRTNELEKKQSQPPSGNSPTRLRLIINFATKTVLTLVSVASILTLAGFQPSFGKRRTQLKVPVLPDLFQSSAAVERAAIQCPPGKVLVMENGEPRCLVKERVEIPFEPVVTTPNVSYGCG